MKFSQVNLDKLKNEGTRSVSSHERRKFLRLGLAIAGVYAGGKLLSVTSIINTAHASVGGTDFDKRYPYNPHYSMVIRQSLCIDCEKCVDACNTTNHVPEYGYRTRILTKKYTDNLDKQVEFIPVLCNQCNNAPCVRACPTRATYKDAVTGIVLMESKKCIGCKTCMLACPYDARYYNAERRAVDKCDFCWDKRLSKKDTQTACSAACPTGSRTFGNLTDPDNIVYKLVHQIEEQVWVIRPADDTKPNIFYMKGNMLSVDNILNEQRFKYFDPNKT
jgi:Fe-S-cluster-containing dehydrogenase component